MIRFQHMLRARLCVLAVSAAAATLLAGLPLWVCLTTTLAITVIFGVVLFLGRSGLARRDDHGFTISLLGFGGLGFGIAPTAGHLIHMWVSHSKHLLPTPEWVWAGMGLFWTCEALWWLTLPPHHSLVGERWRQGLWSLLAGAMMWSILLLNYLG